MTAPASAGSHGTNFPAQHCQCSSLLTATHLLAERCAARARAAHRSRTMHTAGGSQTTPAAPLLNAKSQIQAYSSPSWCSNTSFASLPPVCVPYTKPGSHTFLSVDSSAWFTEHHWTHFKRIQCWKMIFSESFINLRVPNHICSGKRNSKRSPNKNNRTIIAWKFWLPINYKSIQLCDNLCFHLWNHSCY